MALRAAWKRFRETRYEYARHISRHYAGPIRQWNSLVFSYAAVRTAVDVARGAVGVLIFIPAVICFKDNIGLPVAVRGHSMHPYLNSDLNDKVSRDVVWNYRLGAGQNLERGMVVFLRSPKNPEVQSIKRVVGLEGDIIRTKAPYPHAHIEVPAGHVWVEGDGEKSLDSNHYGPVSRGLITGRMTFILSPWEKFGPVRYWEHVFKRNLGSSK